MRFWHYLRIMLVPRLCVICEKSISYDLKVPLCDDCLEVWDKQLNVKCVTCGKKRDSCKCVPKHLKGIVPFVCWGVFYTGDQTLWQPDGILKVLKEVRSREIVDFCSEQMKKSIITQCKIHRVNYKDFAITYAPRTAANSRMKGLDQSKELAKALAKKLGIDFVCAFKNKGRKQQKKLNKEKRIENARKSYKIHKKFEMKHKHYFLVDDVLTSGSTFYFCANLLYENGAETVVPVAYCKDNIKKQEKRKFLFLRR